MVNSHNKLPLIVQLHGLFTRYKNKPLGLHSLIDYSEEKETPESRNPPRSSQTAKTDQDRYRSMVPQLYAQSPPEEKKKRRINFLI